MRCPTSTSMRPARPLARIAAATRGVTLRVTDGQRFVLLPSGTLSLAEVIRAVRDGAEAAHRADRILEVEHLGGQVTRLLEDYRTLAETLRGRWG